MKIASTAVALVLMGLALRAQTSPPVSPAPQQQSPALPGTAPVPGTQTVPPAAQPAPQAPVPGAPPVPTPILPPVPAAPVLTRTFTATTGLLFSAVRPERAFDFETVIGLLQDALKASTDPAVRAQAAGWRMYKATEPGPNATVLYVFVIDPAIAGADYGLGRILADAYPDRIQEIWKLYTGALAGGGSLLNLTPVVAPPPTQNTPTITDPATPLPGGRGTGAAPPAGRGATPARPAPPAP
jgi:hypothetical protein